LFLEEQVMKKLREVTDNAQLFFLTDDTKIKGNKAYDLGQYYKALEIYEQVIGVYIWLDLKDEELKDKMFTSLEFPGLFDKDVELKTRRIINEGDREIETETSKN
jgi:hypothetical protein